MAERMCPECGHNGVAHSINKYGLAECRRVEKCVDPNNHSSDWHTQECQACMCQVEPIEVWYTEDE